MVQLRATRTARLPMRFVCRLFYIRLPSREHVLMLICYLLVKDLMYSVVDEENFTHHPFMNHNASRYIIHSELHAIKL